MSAHEAGREMDALVAEKVMGRDYGIYVVRNGARVLDADMNGLPHYSTDIAAAWTVVEKHGLGDWNWRVSQTDASNWFAEVRLGYESSYSAAFPAWAETAPLAICRAALAAVGTEVPA